MFTNSLSSSFHSQVTQAPLRQNDYPMLTRVKTDKSKPKTFLAHIEPSTIKQALSQTHWFEAMKVKYDSFMNNGTWELTPLPPHRKKI